MNLYICTSAGAACGGGSLLKICVLILTGCQPNRVKQVIIIKVKVKDFY